MLRSCLIVVSMGVTIPVMSGISRGDITVTTSANPNQLAFASEVSNSDLLHGISGTHVGYLNSPLTTGPLSGPRLNDGLYGGANDSNAIAWGINGPIGTPVTFSTFELGLGANGLGWDITEVASFAAWADTFFMNQKYDVSVRYAGESDFELLYQVNYLIPAIELPGGSGSSKVTAATDDGSLLASGVDAIRFSIYDAVSGYGAGGSTYREIDVFGVSTSHPDVVPEPASIACWALLGLGAVGIAALRLRQAKRVGAAAERFEMQGN